MDTNAQEPKNIESVTPKPVTQDSSTIYGVSLRGIITTVIILTICVMSALKTEIKEPLYTLGGMVAAFYFGHQQGLATKK